MRQYNTNEESVLLMKTNMSAGHMGASGRYGFLKEIAFEWAFVLDMVGLLDQDVKITEKNFALDD